MTPAPVGLRCPEHSGKPQGVQRVVQPAQRAVTGVGSSRINAVTMALIGINVAVYLVELGMGGSIDGGSNWIFAHGALVVNGITQGGNLAAVPAHELVPGFKVVGVAHGDWWRIVTAAFLHAGPLHLGLNMYSLFWAGTLLEQLIGRWRFVLLYFAAGIAGSAGAILWSPNQVSLGASGAIFGILGGLYVLERRGNISTGGQIGMLIVLNLVFTFALASVISVGAHVGGLIAGVVLMALLHQYRRSAAMSVAGTVGVVVVSLVLAYSKVRGYQ
jgi:membrane associated rhomboid family serine protease